jgi:Reverse transcriptase (RNA-dependent DNA polymerase)
LPGIWLIRFLEHRIGDRRIIRLIQKWLKAGVLEEGAVSVSERGMGQGSAISPLLANIYLHYALDLWAVRWRRREATGDMIIVRYADDFIVGFQHESDARRFLDEMRERLRKLPVGRFCPAGQRPRAGVVCRPVWGCRPADWAVPDTLLGGPGYEDSRACA